MPTPNYVFRFDPDLRRLAEARAAEEHRNLSALMHSAVRAYLTGDDGGEVLNHAVRKMAELEAELEQARAELERARQGFIRNRASGLEKQARVIERQGREDRYAAALTSATRENPVTAPRLSALSGWNARWCRDLAIALTGTGYAEKVGPGQWIAVPGRDVREGLQAARKLAQHGAATIAPHKREARDGSPPAAVPPEPAAEAVRPAEGKSAAAAERPRQRRTAARERAGSGSPPLAAADRQRPVMAEPEDGQELDGQELWDRYGDDAEEMREQLAPGLDELRERAGSIAPATAVFQQPGADRVVTSEVPEAKTCPPHPKRRVVKGLCGACGRNVGFEKLA